MKRIALAAAAALALMAAPALADVNYYLNSSTGNDGDAGTSAAAAWRTMTKANADLPAANTANGHVIVHLAPGTYTKLPIPPSAAADGKRYFFYGDIADPSKVTINPQGDWTNVAYVSLRGVTFSDRFDIDGGSNRDTLRNCNFNAGKGLSINDASYIYVGETVIRHQTQLTGWVHADDLLVYDTTAGLDTIVADVSGGFAEADVGEYIFGRGLDPRAKIIAKIDNDSLQVDIVATSSQNGTTGQLYPACVGITFESCQWPNLGNNSSLPGYFYGRGTDSLTVLRSQFTIVNPSSADNDNPTHFTRFFSTSNDLWKYNHWKLTNLKPDATGWRMFGVHRDFSYNHKTVKDTILAFGTGPILPSYANSGSYSKSTGGATFDSMWVFITTPPRSSEQGGWSSTERFQDLTFTNNVVISTSSPAWTVADLFGRCKITGNTFVGRAAGGVFNMRNNVPNADRVTYSDTITVKNNIFYSLDQGDPQDLVSNKYAASYSPARFDSACVEVVGDTTIRICPTLDIHHNLYSYYGFKNWRAGNTGQPSGDRSIYHEATWFPPFPNNSSPPGDSITTNLSRWEGRYDGADSASVYGSPKFADSTLTVEPENRAGTSFVPALLYGSAAIDNGEGGVDMGAIAFTGTPMISLSKTALVFHATAVGNSATADLYIRNDGDADLEISAIAQAGAAIVVAGSYTGTAPTITADRDTAQIAPGDSRLVTFSTVSTSANVFGGNMAIWYNPQLGGPYPVLTYKWIQYTVVTPEGNIIND